MAHGRWRGQSPRTELLAPAGDWQALRAAVANGADAVYFGVSGFNARARATNFTMAELPGVVNYLHGHNTRAYVALNTLIFSDELEAVAEMVAAMADAGVDAVIVQDLGLAALTAALAPTLAVHASTQMTLTEAMGVEWAAQRLGVSRAILARELSLTDIAAVRQGTNVPVEVFVHGALCVAYSGQCLTSEALGGRSANRGQCAQACRLPYQMVVDGQTRDLGDRAYLLSPQDLWAPDLVGRLVALGVSCLKIEGRLKSPYYVAATTQTYRAALDSALAGQPYTVSATQRADLEQSFNRGLTHGFLDGVNHQRLVAGRFPKSRGLRVGRVVSRTAWGLEIELADGPLAEPVKPGDGVVFDEGRPDSDEQGGRVYEVIASGRDRRELRFGRGDMDPQTVAVGAIVWKTDDPAMRHRLGESFAADHPVRRVPLTVHVRAVVGEELQLRLSDDAGHAVELRWSGRPLERAVRQPLTLETLRDQLGRLGATPFVLGEVVGEPLEPVMVPKSILNDLRRKGIDELTRQRADSARHTLTGQAQDTVAQARTAANRPASPGDQIMMTVLVRTLAQARDVATWRPPPGLTRPGMVYCDFEDVRGYRQAVEELRAAGLSVGLATLRVIKPGELGLLRAVAQANPDAVLVRNLTAVAYYRTHEPAMTLIGDFSLNVANELTAAVLFDEGLAHLTASLDLNWDQLRALAGRTAASRLEVIAHQHMPMFHMDHCVFAAFLSQGRDHRDCGRPCDRHRVTLRDRVGAEHPVIADVGCRNTVYNAAAQSAAEFFGEMQQAGLRRFRLELLDEQGPAVGSLLSQYAAVLAGQADGRDLWRQLRVTPRLGVAGTTPGLVADGRPLHETQRRAGWSVALPLAVTRGSLTSE